MSENKTRTKKIRLADVYTTWPQLKGEYKGSASAGGYTLETALNLSDKNQT